MKYKSLIPRGILAALLAALQLCSLLSLYIIYDFTKSNASSIVRLPSGGYTMQVDPWQWILQILSTSWIWGAALLCILIAITILIFFCIGRGKPSIHVAVMSAVSSVGHMTLLLGFVWGGNDPLRTLEVVCHSMVRSILQKLSLLPGGNLRPYLGLIMITVLCVCFTAGVLLSLALLLIELIVLKKEREAARA